MLTDRDYTDTETTLELKKLGFPKWYIYHDLILNKVQTLLYHAQKWLREEKGIIVLVHHLMTQEGDWEWELSYKYRSKDMYHSYEEALLEGIKEAIKILKEK